METKPTKKTLGVALAKFRQMIDPIEKEAENPHFRSKYADLSSIIEAIKTPLDACGLTLTHSVIHTDHGYDVCTTLSCVDTGEAIQSHFPMFGAKAQEFGSSITYARRYNTQALLDLPTTEDDDGNKANEAPRVKYERPTNTKKYVSKATKQEIVDLISNAGVSFGTIEELTKWIESNGYALGNYGKPVVDEIAKEIKLLSIKKTIESQNPPF